MVSTGNPNQSGGGPFDIPKFFNPSTPSSTVMTTNFPTSNYQNPSSNAIQNLAAPQPLFPLPSASYPPPTGGPAGGPYSFQPPNSSPFHNPPSQFLHPFHPEQFSTSGGNPHSASSQDPPPQFSNHLHPHPQRSISFHTLQPPLTSSPQPGHFPNPQNVGNVNTTNETPGARLMALLSASPSSLEMSQQPAVPMTHVQPMISEASNLSVSHSVPSGPSTGISIPVPNPMGMLSTSSKLPKGRHLIGDHDVYDIDVRLPGEVQPQLEVTPITKYGSDPGLVLGRQIAVNKTYICYGLKLGAVRVLNINTALRSLLKGLAQRVTDMAFFAEDVHLLAGASVDGRAYIWKIFEDSDEEDKPQITVKIVTAVQFNSDGESVHPRVCWHCHKQEVLVVGIGRRVLKIDTTKVGKGAMYSAEEPIKCHIDKLIDGIQLVGSHDGEVTDLSMCQWMTSRLVSASVDGTIKVWEDRKTLPIAVLRPHDGHPVNSVTFVTAPHRPDHIILITGGPLNREVKIWVSASEEGWLLPSDSESWRCIQTLELKSSSELHMEEAFFNQVIALSQAGLLLLANAKKNAIYAVHLDFGSYPAASHMDYVAEFTVTMPILSFTGTSSVLPHGEQIVQVYCIQTQAIQQYALDLSQCLPPLMENHHPLLDKSNSSASRDAKIADVFVASEPSETKATETTVSVSPSTVLIRDSGSVTQVLTTSVSSELATSHEIVAPIASSPHPLSPRLSRNPSGLKSPSKNSESEPLVNDVIGDSKVIESSVDNRETHDISATSDVGSNDLEPRNDDMQFKHPTHLVTPSEILMANSSSEVNHVSEHECDSKINSKDVMDDDAQNVQVDVMTYGQNREIGSSHEEEHQTFGVENKEKTYFYSQASDLGMQMARVCRVTEIAKQIKGSQSMAQPLASNEGACGTANDVPRKVVDSDPQVQIPQALQLGTKWKKPKGKNTLGAGPLSPSPSTSNLLNPLNNTGAGSGSGAGITSLEDASSRLISVEETLNQLYNAQKDMLKQMNNTLSVPVTKEGKRLETALGKSIEKSCKVNTDALWAHFQEDNVKRERSSKDRNQQMTSLITNCINKDLPAMVEKAVKKELATLGQAVARTIAPVIEKTVSTAIIDSFQKGVADKAVSQLEKSLNSKLESIVARQIQTQFQTSGKQALQETLKSSMEASVIPAFEMSCKAMFEQIDAAFQKGMSEHATVALQQFDASHSSLSLSLRDALNSASSVTQILSGELADGQRKLIALAADSKVINPIVQQITNGPLGVLHEKPEAPLDPTKELARLTAERKYEEAFSLALQRSDVSIVSWLCSQVDLIGIVSMNPLPLSQGVLLSLLQQLACDIGNESSKKLLWMRDILTAINTNDPMIAVHVRPIFQQVYSILDHRRNIPTVGGQELSNIRLIMHVINSMLMTYK